MKLLKIINPENVSEEEAKDYPNREAGRAIVIDEDNKIAILHVTEKNYFKLPGGGIESGEDKIAAVKRECLEEIGCDVEIIGEIGSIIEYRKLLNPRNLKQTSYCYLAKVIGIKGKPEYTEHEKKNGFENVWLSYDEALKALTESKALSNEGKYYIVPRDRALLEEARLHLDSVIN